MCSLHDSLPGIESLKKQVLSGTSEYNYYHSYILIFFELAIKKQTQTIIEISMHLYIWLHSIDKSDTEEYMEFSRKCCIGCMEAYTYGDCVYFNNMTDKPNNIIII